jgi:hypothetical protein
MELRARFLCRAPSCLSHLVVEAQPREALVEGQRHATAAPSPVPVPIAAWAGRRRRARPGGEEARHVVPRAAAEHAALAEEAALAGDGRRHVENHAPDAYEGRHPFCEPVVLREGRQGHGWKTRVPAALRAAAAEAQRTLATAPAHHGGAAGSRRVGRRPAEAQWALTPAGTHHGGREDPGRLHCLAQRGEGHRRAGTGRHVVVGAVLFLLVRYRERARSAAPSGG